MRFSTQGFTLIETLISSAILVIFFGAVALIIQIGLQNLGSTRVRDQAISLVQARIEEARNTPYLSLGTANGIPDGIFAQAETINLNGVNFERTTKVIYIDDPYDDLAPTDATPTDYKRVEVGVTWDGMFASATPLTGITDVSSSALETDSGGGTIELSVFNAFGQPVPQAEVVISAPEATPSVQLTTYTDLEGKVILPGAPECSECYQINVTKAGMTGDRTYGIEEVANPHKPHLTVLPGQVTQSSFAIDTPAQVTFRAVRTKPFNFTPFTGVQMRVRGSKEIGRTDLDLPIYLYDQQIVTGTNGTVVVPNMVWDTYFVSIPSGSSVDMAATWPFTPFSVVPGSAPTFIGVVAAQTANTLLVRAVDALGAPVTSASVELTNIDPVFTATQAAGLLTDPDRSQAFFANLPTTLSPYTIRLLAPGFNTVVTEATVSGDTVENYILNPN